MECVSRLAISRISNVREATFYVVAENAFSVIMLPRMIVSVRN
jgi:hypothetical protein